MMTIFNLTLFKDVGDKLALIENTTRTIRNCCSKHYFADIKTYFEAACGEHNIGFANEMNDEALAVEICNAFDDDIREHIADLFDRTIDSVLNEDIYDTGDISLPSVITCVPELNPEDLIEVLKNSRSHSKLVYRREHRACSEATTVTVKRDDDRIAVMVLTALESSYEPFEEDDHE